MTERPILFSDAMVRAILAGTKTQTRRVVVVRGSPVSGAFWDHAGWRPSIDEDGAIRFRVGGPGGEEAHGSPEVRCPYGAPGDRLWVRECFALHHAWDEHAPTRGGAASKRVWFRAHHDSGIIDGIGRWRPSIHMPRWASRLTLEVTSVRIERVQSITESDARAEGVTPDELGDVSHWRACRVLWDSINGERPGCSWSANPWVWAVGFRVVPR